MEKSKTGRRFLCILLSLVMLVTAIPCTAFADTIAATEPVLTDGVYQISSAGELQWFANQVNSGAGKNYNAILTQDIDLENNEWTPIGNSAATAYNGTFDGNGKKILNLNVNGSGNNGTGLFGQSTGVIMKLTVESGSVTVNGGSYAGGIAGINRGIIFCCGNKADVTVVNASGRMLLAGGITGQSAGTVVNCYNIGNITGTLSYPGNMGGQDYIAGIAGQATAGKILNCYNTGNIIDTVAAGHSWASGIANHMTTGATVSNCYNVGTITNAWTAQLWSLSIANTNSYYLDTTKKKDTQGTAKTADEMKAIASDLGAAFASDDNNINGGYPVLAWQNTGTYPKMETLSDHVLDSVVNAENGTVTVKLDGAYEYVTPTKANFTLQLKFGEGAEEGEWQNEEITAMSYDNANDQYKLTFTKLVYAPVDCNVDVKVTFNGGEAKEKADCFHMDGLWVTKINEAINGTLEITLNRELATGTYLDVSDFQVSCKRAGETEYTEVSGMIGNNGTRVNGENSDIVVIYYDMLPAAASGTSDDVEIKVSYLGGAAKTADMTVYSSRDWRDYAVKPSQGDGTESNPFIITSAEELGWFANYADENTDACAELGKNIYLNENSDKHDTWGPYNSDLMNWKQICGVYNKPYNGTFDGKGYTIYGMYCVGEKGGTSSALFGYVTGTIKNLNVAESYVFRGSGIVCVLGQNGDGKNNLIENCSFSGILEADSGNNYGGICGQVSMGTVRNCRSEGSYAFKSKSNSGATMMSYGGICGEGGIIENCINSADIDTTGIAVGGICGNSPEKIIGCVNVGNITDKNQTATGTKYGVGGIAGYSAYANCVISNCYNRGNLTDNSAAETTAVGGIIGRAYYTPVSVNNCYNTGTISVTDGGFKGELVGLYRSAPSSEYSVVPLFCYSTGGTADEAGLTKVTDNQLKSQEITDKLGEYFYADSDNINDGYPVLYWQIGKDVREVKTEYTNDLWNEKEQAYIIQYASDIKTFRDSLAEHDYSGETVLLANNIIIPPDFDVGSVAWGYNECIFNGYFNGQGYTISGFADATGFFNIIGTKGIVTKLNLVVDTKVEGEAGKYVYYAPIAYKICGKAVYVSVKGNVQFSGGAYTYISGIASTIDASFLGNTNIAPYVSDCFTKIDFRGENDGSTMYIYGIGSVSGNTSLATQYIKNIYTQNTYDVTMTTAGKKARIYPAGSGSASYVDSASIFYDSDLATDESNTYVVTNSTALTSDEMKDSAKFAGYDFKEVWNIDTEGSREKIYVVNLNEVPDGKEYYADTEFGGWYYLADDITYINDGTPYLRSDVREPSNSLKEERAVTLEIKYPDIEIGYFQPAVYTPSVKITGIEGVADDELEDFIKEYQLKVSYDENKEYMIYAHDAEYDVSSQELRKGKLTYKANMEYDFYVDYADSILIKGKTFAADNPVSERSQENIDASMDAIMQLSYESDIEILRKSIEQIKNGEGVEAFLKSTSGIDGDWQIIDLARYPEYWEDPEKKAEMEEVFGEYFEAICILYKEAYTRYPDMDCWFTTTLQRGLLTVTAMGFDPADIKAYTKGVHGEEDEGFDLVKAVANEVGKTGAHMHVPYYLIGLDSGDYPAGDTYEEDVNNRAEMVYTLARGGFGAADSIGMDYVAMFAHGLAKYVNPEEGTIYYDVAQIVNERLQSEGLETIQESADHEKLIAEYQKHQCPLGGWITYAHYNAATTAQAIIQLSVVGIDAFGDERLMTSAGYSLLDSIIFCGYEYDDEGVPTGEKQVTGQYYVTTSRQSFYAIASVYRVRHDMNALYDCTDVTGVKDVKAMIDALPDTYSEESKEDLVAAFKAYNNLSDIQKKYIQNTDKLTNLNAAAVAALIDGIKTPITLDSKAELDAVNAVYESLSPEEKSHVDNYSTLAGYMKEYAQLKADECDRLISDIGDVTLDKEAKIREAREYYSSLTDDEKALVKNISLLVKAEKELALLKGPGSEIENLVPTQEPPATGDSQAETLWIMLILLSVSGIVSAAAKRKRKA